MTIKSIKQAKNLSGKKALLRVDFNVPLSKGSTGRSAKIKDDFKIMAGLPTIRFLLRYNCAIIIMTHLGRPEGKAKQEYSTRILAARLEKVLGRKVKFAGDCAGFKAGTEASRLKKGEILMLENLRFHHDEKNNNLQFAKRLASYADIYVNDAFAASHRAHASVSAIKKYLPAYAGLLLEQEIINLNKVLKPEQPLIAVIGGSKVETKMRLLNKLHKKAFRILIGGALANNFLAAHKISVGKSPVDKKSITFAKKFLDKNVILPVDAAVGEKKDGSGEATIRNIYEVKNNEIIFDIGPRTIKLYSNFIKKAKTIIWNGPMGKFESGNFKFGTLSMARSIASRATGKAFAAVGGGETIEALNMSGMLGDIDWVSTGGGAMLSYLGDEKMPGLKGLIK